MSKHTINNINYELIKEYRDGFDLEEVTSKLTDYFEGYDYIVGDWAYGKLRLKGFYDKSNKKANKINNFDNLDDYINNYCAKNCRYFVMKKII